MHSEWFVVLRIFCTRSKKIKHPDLLDWDGSTDPVIMAIMKSIKTKCKYSAFHYILFFVGTFQLVIGVFYILQKNTTIKVNNDDKPDMFNERYIEPEDEFNPRLYIDENSSLPFDVWNDHVTNLSVKVNTSVSHSTSKVNQNLKGRGFKTKNVNRKSRNRIFSDKFLEGQNDKPLCPFISPHLGGPILINTRKQLTFEMLEEKFTNLRNGGFYSPASCKARHKVAIIVPYRNRRRHLQTFLGHMHPFLQKQQLQYAIFVVELNPNLKFNKGVLLNTGFLEADRLGDFDCFIFHDVDLLPENDNNLYICSPTSPKHLSVAVSTFRYKLPDSRLIGGVNAMTKEQFVAVNGYTNKFYGWGGEDDDLYFRFFMLRIGRRRWKHDGLNTIKYKVINIEMLKLCTYILIDIDINDPAFKI